MSKNEAPATVHVSGIDDVRKQGYTVLRQVVTSEMCEAVVTAIRDELGIDRDDPATWERVSAELDQVPLWAHQAQWEIRQMPALYSFWASLYGIDRLWVTFDSCRFSPPWQPGRRRPWSIHWDHDPRDDSFLCYQGLVALSSAPLGAGGFRCAPHLGQDRDRWPSEWPEIGWPAPATEDELVEIPVEPGDVLVWDWRLPHGNSVNHSDHPRIVFYLSYVPAGSANEARQRVDDFQAGRTSAHWRWKPGHDRQAPGPPAVLTQLGRRLLGEKPWP